MKKWTCNLLVLILVSAIIIGNVSAAKTTNPKKEKNDQRAIVELLFSRPVTSEDLSLIKKLGGTVIYRFDEINGLVVFINSKKTDELMQSLDGLKDYGYAVRVEALSETLPSNCSSHGTVLTWNLDMINVPTVHEEKRFDGSGVYIAVLDTGLEPEWRSYFPEERIDTEHAAAFLGAQATAYWVTGEIHNDNAWEADTHGHGMHVTSTIIGFNVYDIYTVDGVAPRVKVIPVKVLSNAGWGFSTDVAAGILYIASLYREEVETGGDVLPPEDRVNPVIISMSLGGPAISPVEKEAIDYAIKEGVFIVAAAGNSGEKRMDYPGAYEPVISVGAAGWIGEWSTRAWWRTHDVPEDLEGQIYVCVFSGREKEGQDLDVLAPGSWVVGPYTPYGAAHPPYWSRGVPGQYYYVGGTSMATPHVSGVLALVLQKDLVDGNVDLNQTLAEVLLEDSSIKITWHNATVLNPYTGEYVTVEWNDDAIGSGLIQADCAVDNFENP